jgi:hypothetical protein
MSRGIVDGYTKKGSKGRRQKQVNKRNYFSLGFETGFTKNLLKISPNSSKTIDLQNKVNVIIEAENIKANKKSQKKKKIVVSTTNKKKKKD